MSFVIVKNKHAGVMRGSRILRCEEYETEEEARGEAEEYIENQHGEMSEEDIKDLNAGDYTLEIWDSETWYKEEGKMSEFIKLLAADFNSISFDVYQNQDDSCD